MAGSRGRSTRRLTPLQIINAAPCDMLMSCKTYVNPERLAASTSSAWLSLEQKAKSHETFSSAEPLLEYYKRSTCSLRSEIVLILVEKTVFSAARLTVIQISRCVKSHEITTEKKTRKRRDENRQFESERVKTSNKSSIQVGSPVEIDRRYRAENINYAFTSSLILLIPNKWPAISI
jgi:hypothetical protein